MMDGLMYTICGWIKKIKRKKEECVNMCVIYVHIDSVTVLSIYFSLF